MAKFNFFKWLFNPAGFFRDLGGEGFGHVLDEMADPGNSDGDNSGVDWSSYSDLNPSSSSWIVDLLKPIGGFFQPLTNVMNMLSGVFTGIGNLSENELFNQGYSWLNQFTGANLTGQQQQMNEFNAEQAAIQRGWQERLSNTSYQRAVADLSSAGINPAMVMGGSSGASTPSGAFASGTSMSAQGAAILDLLMNRANLAMQDKMSQRQSDSAIKTAEIAADAQVQTALIQERWQKRGQDINEALTRENILLANRELDLHEYLTTAQVDEINRNIDLIKEKISSEKANSILSYAQSRLADTQSNRIKMLLSAEYTNLLLQGDLMVAQRVEALASNYLKTTEAAWKAGLIDAGMLDSMIKESSANAALRQRLVDIKNGKPFKDDYGDLRDIPNKLLNIVFGNVVQAIDAVGGAIVGSLIK